MKRITWIVLGVLGIHAAVQAASFDCSKATSKTEMMICLDAGLSKLDENLSAAYKAAIQDEKQSDITRQSQKQWIKSRNTCQDFACVKNSYEERLTFLNQVKLHSDNSASDNSMGMEFIPFQKETCCLDDPFEYSSREAESLWAFIVLREPRLSTAWGENSLRNGGSFANLGKNGYLVFLDAFYFAEPKENRLAQLTKAWPPGTPEEPEFRRIGSNRLWALISGTELSHGVYKSSYYAIFIEFDSLGTPSVSSIELLSIHETYDGLCEGGDVFKVTDVATHVDSQEIKDVNSDKLEDIVFQLEQQDCKSKLRQKLSRIFINSGNSFIEQKQH